MQGLLAPHNDHSSCQTVNRLPSRDWVESHRGAQETDPGNSRLLFGDAYCNKEDGQLLYSANV